LKLDDDQKKEKDEISAYLTSYGTSIKYEDLPSEVVHKVKGLFIDALACGIGAYASDAGKIARRLAEQVYHCDMPASILGSSQKSNPELATFANGVMIRYLDFNDGFYGKKGRGHPSDNFAPVLTCADAVHAGGKEVIVASVLAYEVFCRICDQSDIISVGFDQAVIGVISSVIGVSKILGLSQEQMVEALNLAIVSNLCLRQARQGTLSMWKACTFAHAARNAVSAALLAKEGMTGPGQIFEGKYGLFKVVSGPFRLDEFGGNGRTFRIMDVSIKRYPCGQHAQTAVDVAIKLRSKISSLNDIAEINIGTFAVGKSGMAGGDEKWHPETRETADHSIPYVVGVALMYGSLEVKHFSKEYLQNPTLLDLIRKIKVEENDECNRLHPDASANRMEIITKSGEKFSEFGQYHRGHHRNPLTDEEIEQKFHSVTGELLSPTQRGQLLRLLWDFEHVDDVRIIMDLLKI
jgi:2-methylcitrate dehydratase